MQCSDLNLCKTNEYIKECLNHLTLGITIKLKKKIGLNNIHTEKYNSLAYPSMQLRKKTTQDQRLDSKNTCFRLTMDSSLISRFRNENKRITRKHI